MAERLVTATAVAALIALSAGCESDTTASSPISRTIVAPDGAPGSSEVPVGFERTIAVLTPAGVAADAVELDLWYAGTPEQWHRGLIGVTDLDGADGMLFVFETAAEHNFHMWQTPMPLDIHFFDERAHLVGSERMTPCLDEASSACERYSAGTAFRTALEVPAGALDEHDLDGSWTISFEPPYDR